MKTEYQEIESVNRARAIVDGNISDEKKSSFLSRMNKMTRLILTELRSNLYSIRHSSRRGSIVELDNCPDVSELSKSNNTLDKEGIALPCEIDGVVYFSQHDTSYADLLYSVSENRKDQTIETSGCMPVSLAMIVSTLTQKVVKPEHICNFSINNGFRTEESGTKHSLARAICREYGLKYKRVYLSDSPLNIISSTLAKGGLVLVSGKDSDPRTPATESGHFFVVRKITDEGKILVSDPNSYEFSLIEFLPEEIIYSASFIARIWKD